MLTTTTLFTSLASLFSELADGAPAEEAFMLNGGDPNPWAGADWTASWRRTAVNDAEWKALRENLRGEVRRWHAALQKPRELNDLELNGVIASIGHLAYHLGAIRQIDRALQGPKA